MLRPTIHYSTHRLDEAKNITTLRLANRLVEATLLPNVEENNRTKISKLKCSATNPHSMQCFANATNDSTLHPNYRLVEATLLKDVEEKLDKPICGQAKMLCLGQQSKAGRIQDDHSFVRKHTNDLQPSSRSMNVTTLWSVYRLVEATLLLIIEEKLNKSTYHQAKMLPLRSNHRLVEATLRTIVHERSIILIYQQAKMLHLSIYTEVIDIPCFILVIQRMFSVAE